MQADETEFRVIGDSSVIVRVADRGTVRWNDYVLGSFVVLAGRCAPVSGHVSGTSVNLVMRGGDLAARRARVVAALRGCRFKAIYVDGVLLARR